MLIFNFVILIHLSFYRLVLCLHLMLMVCLLPSLHVHEVLNYGYEIVEKYDHDPDAFTQGLVF